MQPKEQITALMGRAKAIKDGAIALRDGYDAPLAEVRLEHTRLNDRLQGTGEATASPELIAATARVDAAKAALAAAKAELSAATNARLQLSTGQGGPTVAETRKSYTAATSRLAALKAERGKAEQVHQLAKRLLAAGAPVSERIYQGGASASGPALDALGRELTFLENATKELKAWAGSEQQS